MSAKVIVEELDLFLLEGTWSASEARPGVASCLSLIPPELLETAQTPALALPFRDTLPGLDYYHRRVCRVPSYFRLEPSATEGGPGRG